MTFPLDELIDAGAPSLPDGYFYTFDVQESGNLNGYLWSASGKQIGQRYLWITNLTNNGTQWRTWEIYDLVRLANNLFEDAFPPKTPKEKFAPNIARFLGEKFFV